MALNRSHDSLVNGGTEGYCREESGVESDEAFSDWDSCEELMLVCIAYIGHVYSVMHHCVWSRNINFPCHLPHLCKPSDF